MSPTDRTPLIAAVSQRFLLLESKDAVAHVSGRQLSKFGFAAATNGSVSADGKLSPASLIRFGITVLHGDGPAAARHFLRQFSKYDDYAFITAICTGSNDKTAEALTAFPLERYAINPGEVGALEVEAVRSLFGKELSKYGVTLPMTIDGMRTLNAIVTGKADRGVVRTFGDLTDYLERSHPVLWPYLFGDFFILTAKLMRAESKVTRKELDRALVTSRCLGFELLTTRLITLRALSGSRVERLHLLKHREHVLKEAALPPDLEYAIRQVLAGEVIDPEDVALGGSIMPVEDLIRAQLFVYASGDEQIFLKRLAIAYDLDESIIRFLDWQRLWPTIKMCARVAEPELVFLSTVLTSDVVIKRFPFLFYGYWNGGASADLEHYVLAVRGRGAESSLVDFMQSLTALPPKARDRVFRHLFHPTVIERLATLLTPVTRRHAKAPGEEYYSLFAQLSLLEFLEVKNILDREFIAAKRAEVRAFMRQLRYSANRNDGMIRVDPIDLAREVQRFIDREAVVYRAVVKGMKAPARHIVATLAKNLGHRLSTHVCFHSRVAFDYILSNRLRHGWLDRRMEKASLDFFEEFPTSTMDQAWIANELKGLTDLFCQKQLTIAPDGPLVGSLGGIAGAWFEAYLLRKDARVSPEAVGELSVAMIEELSKTLLRSQEAWLGAYRDSVVDIAASASATAHTIVKKIESDHLVAHLRSAVADTAMWIAVNARNVPTEEPVSVRELVEFEIKTVTVNDPDQTSLKFEIYDSESNNARRRGFDVLIPQKYLDVIVSIVDNTVQNAFAKSGMKYRTPIKVVVGVSRRSVTLEIQNSFRRSDLARNRRSATRAGEAVAKAKAMSTKELLDKRAGEGGRGLVKIFYECNEAFGKAFSVRVINTHLGEGWFTLKFTLPIVGAKLVPGGGRSAG